MNKCSKICASITFALASSLIVKFGDRSVNNSSSVAAKRRWLN